MDPQGQVRLISPEELTDAAGTAGITRKEAVATSAIWSGVAHTEPRTMSGWHHHGDHDTVAYVLAGTVRVEFGSAGSQAVEAREGDFVYVPGGVVHREGNPGSQPGRLAVFRAGSGPPVINVDGPPA